MFTGHRVSVWEGEEALELLVGWLHSSADVLNAIELYALKGVQTVNLMLCMLYHSENLKSKLKIRGRQHVSCDISATYLQEMGEDEEPSETPRICSGAVSTFWGGTQARGGAL